MKNDRPWQPHLRTLPLLIPFGQTTEWTKEHDADEPIGIELEGETEVSVPTEPIRTTPTDPDHADLARSEAHI